MVTSAAIIAGGTLAAGGLQAGTAGKGGDSPQISSTGSFPAEQAIAVEKLQDAITITQADIERFIPFLEELVGQLQVDQDFMRGQVRDFLESQQGFFDEARGEFADNAFLDSAEGILRGDEEFRDPILERDIEERDRIQRETLLRQLGPGGLTSTAGIQTLAEFAEGADRARFGAREKALQTRGTLGLGKRELDLQGQQQGLQGLLAAFGLLGDTLNFPAQAAGLAKGIPDARQSLIANLLTELGVLGGNQGGTQAAIANAQLGQRQNEIAALRAQGLGTALGTATGTLASGFRSRPVSSNTASQLTNQQNATGNDIFRRNDLGPPPIF